ncbi:Undecaprenyl diphosphate synthase [Aulographum hederae CBS 113979]|uniref:ditrans,polycis-polyprenyl diphosphate synthase [(2E,6E)-farnesyldiphosphate specific] n=1 Tax=Aulographum hederae CBS 113979 TaxID=1176131 RepID=A0A6G1GZA4_9PEZI|nr:Undecaprenyl diphosphate synthase [Aulographum hederae CBS 113979]
MSALPEQEAIAFHKNLDAHGRPLSAHEREKLLKKYLPSAPRTTTATPKMPSRKPSKRTRRKPMRAFLLNQTHVLLYTVIHTVFSIYIRLRRSYQALIARAFAVLYYHHRTPELIRKDVKALDKLPEHLSVILQFDEEDGEAGLGRLVSEVAEVAAWCACAGIPVLSVYERTGILKKYMPQTHASINATLTAYFGPGTSASSTRPQLSLRAPNLPSYSPPSTPRSSSPSSSSTTSIPTPTLTVLLLSSPDGRDTLVDLTKTLAEMSQRSKISPQDISADLIDAEISESVMGEPDLLLLFGPRVVLEGYPPWQVRLTEIFCVRDSGEGVSYQVFLRGLYRFGKAQMRFGR